MAQLLAFLAEPSTWAALTAFLIALVIVGEAVAAIIGPPPRR